MEILVAYMPGAVATRRIAEHLAGTLRARGFTADVRPMNGLSGGGRYEGFVIGLAAMTEANRADVGAFMLRHRHGSEPGVDVHVRSPDRIEGVCSIL